MCCVCILLSHDRVDRSPMGSWCVVVCYVVSFRNFELNLEQLILLLFMLYCKLVFFSKDSFFFILFFWDKM